MKTFRMHRGGDESGVSGIGIVLEGTVFSNGLTVIRWLTTGGSVGIYDSFEKFVTIHISSHPANHTVIHFNTGEVLSQDAGTL